MPQPSVDTSLTRSRSAEGGCGRGAAGDGWRHPCFRTEREALRYMEDRLKRIAIFEWPCWVSRVEEAG